MLKNKRREGVCGESVVVGLNLERLERESFLHSGEDDLNKDLERLTE